MCCRWRQGHDDVMVEADVAAYVGEVRSAPGKPARGTVSMSSDLAASGSPGD
jgi:hypothetical protein